jgi:hypothetical protein
MQYEEAVESTELLSSMNLYDPLSSNFLTHELFLLARPGRE